MGEAVKIIIVEDNDMLRENLVRILSVVPGFEVIDSFVTAEESEPVIVQTQPDVLLVDVGLPGMSGIELISVVKPRCARMDIMVHTVFENKDTVFAAIKAGASGYLLKGATPDELVASVQSLVAGGAPMSPKIARAVISEFQEIPCGEPFLLTTREREILMGLEQGFTYKELGNQMCISPHTVHSHIKKIYEKLHAKNRQDALNKAREKGII